MCVLSLHLFWTSCLWTYQPGSHRRKVTQEGHTGFIIHLPSAVLAITFLARKVQPFLSLVDREVKFLCTNELIILHLLGTFFFFFFFRKNPSSCDCTGIQTQVPTSEGFEVTNLTTGASGSGLRSFIQSIWSDKLVRGSARIKLSRRMMMSSGNCGRTIMGILGI